MNSYIIKKPCFKCNYTKVEFQYKTGVFKIQVIRLKQTNNKNSKALGNRNFQSTEELHSTEFSLSKKGYVLANKPMCIGNQRLLNWAHLQVK